MATFPIRPTYLIMVTENNNNKKYELFPQGDTFKVEYGRVGGHISTTSYPMSKWNAQISSKIKKGYVDVTDSKLDIIEDSKVDDSNSESKKVDKFSLIKNESVRSILKRLYEFANKTVQSSYKVTSNQVTQAMLDKAQEQIDYIASNYATWSIEEFNKQLITLFTIIPRKMARVNDYLASSKANKETLDKMIQREQDTLDSMAGMVYIPKSKRIDNNNNSSDSNTENIKAPDEDMLSEMGVEMEDATEEDITKIKKAMGDSSDKFYKAWRVKNIEAENEFQKFMKDNNIKRHKLLCHGSRNTNWFNILKTSLKIRPSNAVYTGSLLGDAIYMSNSEKYHGGVTKSIGYTSLNGYWTRDRQNCGFIAFFDVALGESYDIYSFDSKYHTYNLKKLQQDKPGAWSLHLHGAGYRNGSTVINDEITVYDSRQVSIRYLVEIR